MGLINERSFFHTNQYGAMGSTAGIYSAQIGNFNLNARFLSGDEH